MFQKEDYTVFNYNGFTVSSSMIAFHYSALGSSQIDFNDILEMPFKININHDDLKNLINLVGALLGISYYKAFAGVKYKVNGHLTREGVHFLENCMKHGLAEFCFKNNIPLIKPNVEAKVIDSNPKVIKIDACTPLVAVGGGKDSIVSLEALKRSEINIKAIAVNPFTPHEKTAETAEVDLLNVKHTIDGTIIELNKQGALNGHVPVTAFNSLIMALTSRLMTVSGECEDGGVIVLSNERSADIETTVWQGERINHQWSKSSEAEELLNNAVKSVTGVEISVVSALRDKLEIEIAEAYARNCEKYDDVLVSCNRAYRIEDKNGKWCGDCDKCRFVALVLAPFMSKERLISIVKFVPFQMADLDKYISLVSKEGKPFECVGDIHESRSAFKLLNSHDDWADNTLINSVNQLVDKMNDLPGYDDAETSKPKLFKESIDAFFTK